MNYAVFSAFQKYFTFIYKEVEECTEHMTNIAVVDVADMITYMNIITTIMIVDADMITMTMNADVDMTMDTTTTIIMKAEAAAVADMNSRMKM